MAQSFESDNIRADFIENDGLIVQRDGLPNTADRNFDRFIFASDTVALGELAHRLAISRGNVSSSVRFVENSVVLKISKKTDDRQHHHEVSPDTYEDGLKHSRSGARQARDEIPSTSRVASEVAPDATAAKARIDAHAALNVVIDQGISVAPDRVQSAVTCLAEKD